MLPHFIIEKIKHDKKNKQTSQYEYVYVENFIENMPDEKKPNEDDEHQVIEIQMW